MEGLSRYRQKFRSIQFFYLIEPIDHFIQVTGPFSRYSSEIEYYN